MLMRKGSGYVWGDEEERRGIEHAMVCTIIEDAYRW